MVSRLVSFTALSYHLAIDAVALSGAWGEDPPSSDCDLRLTMPFAATIPSKILAYRWNSSVSTAEHAPTSLGN